MANEKIKVKRYEVYMGNASTIIPANRCILYNNRLVFLSTSDKEVAMFNVDEITGYKVLDITEV